MFEKEKNSSETISNEYSIYISFTHPFVAQVFEFFQTPTHNFIAMEYADRGNLTNYAKRHAKLEERNARKIFLQMLYALDYIQNEKKISHRDLKGENIIMDHYHNMRVIDFGLSKEINKNKLFQTSVGSPAFSSPEVIEGKSYSQECDVWCAGIVLYLMVSGKFPFAGTVQTLARNILSTQPEYSDIFSTQLIDLIQKL
jgi:serine/threonine protein kinase